MKMDERKHAGKKANETKKGKKGRMMGSELMR